MPGGSRPAISISSSRLYMRVSCREAPTKPAELDSTAPTAVVALGLSMYLTAADNRSWLTMLSCLPPGSAVVFDALLPNDAADACGWGRAAITAEADVVPPEFWQANPQLHQQRLVQLIHAEVLPGATLNADESAG
jgi:O-methyltransferase involved in polyketide biosynthesis